MPEPVVRLVAFASVLAVMALWELLAPAHDQAAPRRARWPGNLGIVVVDTLLVRLVFPTAAVGVAMVAEAREWGLLGALSLPVWAEVALSVLALDLVVYGQHVVFHKVPILWRLHRVHHADLALDVTTGLRFHPFEILVSMAIKMAAVAALGAPALGVLIFEVLLNAGSMFAHGNVRLPGRLERCLRLVLVTPEMHRVHHSAERSETDSNYGFCLAWWDRLFATYRAVPRLGLEGMEVGIGRFKEPGQSRLDRLLIQPFRPGDVQGPGRPQVPKR